MPGTDSVVPAELVALAAAALALPVGLDTLPAVLLATTTMVEVRAAPGAAVCGAPPPMAPAVDAPSTSACTSGGKLVAVDPDTLSLRKAA